MYVLAYLGSTASNLCPDLGLLTLSLPLEGGFVNIKNHIMPEGFVSNLPHSPKTKRGNMTIREDSILDVM